MVLFLNFSGLGTHGSMKTLLIWGSSSFPLHSCLQIASIFELPLFLLKLATNCLFHYQFCLIKHFSSFYSFSSIGCPEMFLASLTALTVALLRKTIFLFSKYVLFYRFTLRIFICDPRLSSRLMIILGKFIAGFSEWLFRWVSFFVNVGLFLCF